MSGPVMKGAVANRRLTPPILLVLVVVALILTGIRPYDRLTWFLETFWVMLGVPLVLADLAPISPDHTAVLPARPSCARAHHGRAVHVRPHSRGLLDPGSV